MNDRYKKMLRKMAVFLGILVCLTGCANTNPLSETQPQADLQDDILPFQGQLISAEATHIRETVNDNFHIDADVVGYPADGMAGIYVGSPKVFTKEEINAFVEHCGSRIATAQESDDGDMIYYKGECDNGWIFHYAHSLTQHPYAYLSYRDPVRSELWREYPIYRGEDSYLSNADNMVGWMFTDPREFSFATEAQAELAVREALGVLGLTNLTLLRTLYIDHNTMAEAGQRLVAEERFAPIIGESGNNGFTLRDGWSEDDDAYLFSFGLSVSGIPMSYLYDDSDSTATYVNSEVIVWYTKDGISYLYIDTPWTIGPEESPAQSVVSAHAAMETVKEKYAYDLVREDMQIEELRLMYRYTQDGNRWLLRPVWVARLSYSSTRLDVRLFENMYIDAFTGMEW